MTFKQWCTCLPEKRPCRRGNNRRGRTLKEHCLASVEQQLEQALVDLKRLKDVIRVNEDRILLCKKHKDFKSAFEITQENELLKKESEEVKESTVRLRAKYRKRKWYENRRQKPHLKQFNGPPVKNQAKAESFRAYRRKTPYVHHSRKNANKSLNASEDNTQAQT